MLKLLKTEFGMSNAKIVELSFRDEATILAKLKRTHHDRINKNASIRIQAMAKMYMIRKRYKALMHLRKYSANVLTGHYRR